MSVYVFTFPELYSAVCMAWYEKAAGFLKENKSKNPSSSEMLLPCYPSVIGKHVAQEVERVWLVTGRLLV